MNQLPFLAVWKKTKVILIIVIVLTTIAVILNCSWHAFIRWQAQQAYDRWLNYIIPAGKDMDRVVNPEMDNCTVSEGMGYGLLFTTIYGSNSQFSRLWSYVEDHLNTNGLMDWKIGKNGEVLGHGSATDADQDIAYSLILAETRWSGHGYKSAANKMLHAIIAHETDKDGFLLPGDNWNTTEFLNPSYISPAYYKRFAEVSGDLAWLRISQINESWLSKTLFDKTGLPPDWADRSGHFQTDIFGYDAIRVPIRLLTFYRQAHDFQAKRILEQELQTLNVLKQQGLKAGYTLEGIPTVDYLNTDYLASFTAISLCKPYSPISLSLLWQLSRCQSNSYYGNAMKVWVMSVSIKNLP